ncbi:MAG: hypothetical protein HOE73_00620 [Bacteroidetes Order II. Incertae sedis bacterium]|nr:hypothetical protein [Bacteroidetes Order II. bacterium]
MMALPMESAPTLDGRVTSDPAWDFVPVATGFTQTAPEDGEPATERTEVRIGFTNEMLYVGVVLFDSDPSGLITADTRRDADMGIPIVSGSFWIPFRTDRMDLYLVRTQPVLSMMPN